MMFVILWILSLIFRKWDRVQLEKDQNYAIFVVLLDEYDIEYFPQNSVGF